MRGRVRVGGEEEWEGEGGEGGRRRQGNTWLVVMRVRKGRRSTCTQRMETVRLSTMAARAPTPIPIAMKGGSLALAVVCVDGWDDAPVSRN